LWVTLNCGRAPTHYHSQVILTCVCCRGTYCCCCPHTAVITSLPSRSSFPLLPSSHRCHRRHHCRRHRRDEHTSPLPTSRKSTRRCSSLSLLLDDIHCRYPTLSMPRMLKCDLNATTSVPATCPCTIFLLYICITFLDCINQRAVRTNAATWSC